MKAIIALLFLTATIVYAQLITQNDHGCITSAGYTWCAFENKCVRPWELAKEKGLEMTPENVNSYCNVKKIGSSDSHGCIKSAGYSWCAKENKCVRPWELAQAKDISIKTAQDFTNYCANSTSEVGADSDNHGCIASAGYSWCKKENKCVQPWELAKELKLENTPESVHSYCADCLASAGYSWCEFEGQCIRPWELSKLKNIANTPEAVQSYCSGNTSTTPQPIGGAYTSDHGCIAGAGYSWCQTENKCVRPWEVAQLKNIANTPEAFAQYCNNPTPIGAASGAHNCLASAGYSWCQTENKCVRPWEVAQLKNIANTPEAFAQYCNNPSPIQAIGGESDANGCITGAGYTWCAKENKCVQPWVLAQEKNIKDMTADSFVSYCSQ